MKEVTRDEFHTVVGNQDACIRIENEKYPYTVLFELRQNRELIGKIVDFEEGPKYYINK